MRVWRRFWLGVLIALIMGLIVINSKSTLATPVSDSLRKIAQQVTVAIQEVTCEGREELNPSSCDPNSRNAKLRLQGSGVIVAKNKNTYYVLTADHVVRSTGNYRVVTPDNKAYTAKDIIHIEGTDLAIVPFSSLHNKKGYKLAKLFAFCASEKWEAVSYPGVTLCQTRRSLPDNLRKRDFPKVLVAGYTDDPSLHKLRLEAGVLQDRDFKASIAQSPFSDGYEYIYTNQTQDRMSGGPILDTGGQVIGIHGRLDGENGLAYGYSLGIPIDTFLLRLTDKTDSLAKQLGSVKDLEIEGSMSESPQLDSADVAALLGGETSQCNRLRKQEQSSKQVIEISNRYYRLGKPQEALDCVEVALRTDHDYSPALFAKGYLLFLSGRYSEAREPLEILITQDSNSYIGWRWMGEILLKLEHYDEAEKAFSNAIEKYKKQHPSEDFYQAWSGKALALTKLGKFKDAVAAQEIASFENGFSGLLALGRGKFVTTDFKGASQAYERATHLKKSDPEALIGLARALIQLKQYESAAEKLEEVTNKSNESKELNRRALSQGWFELGHEYEQLAKLREALNCYETAIRISSNNYQAWFYQGVTQYQLNLYDKAYDSFVKALRIRSDSQTTINLVLDIQNLQRLCERYLSDPFSLFLSAGVTTTTGNIRNNATAPPGGVLSNVSLKRVKVSSGRSTRCNVSAQLVDPTLEPIQPIDAIDYVSESDWDLLWKGLDEKDKGDYKSALKAYDQALIINQNFPLVYFHRGLLRSGILQNKSEDIKGAEEDLNQAIQLKSNYYEAYDYRGAIRLNAKNFKGAVEDFTRVIQIYPNHANAYNNRGLARFYLGTYKEAIEDYSQASEFAPSFALAYRNRGDAHSRIGDKKKAIEDYKLAASFFKKQGELDEYTITQNSIQKLE